MADAVQLAVEALEATSWRVIGRRRSPERGSRGAVQFLLRARPGTPFATRDVHNRQVTDVDVRLRPFYERDLELLTRFAVDPTFSEPFEWGGFRSPEGLRRRWEDDGFLENDPHYVVVAGPDDDALGWVMYEQAYRGLGGDGVWVIGIMLAPERRGRGVGTTAQRLLSEHLFGTTKAHRLLALTESANVAEQRALEKCGFRREGVLRQGGFRGGQWRDVVLYGRLRSDQWSADA